MKRKIVSAILAGMLILTTAMPVLAQTAEEKKNDLEGQLGDVKEQKDKVTSQKRKVLNEISELEGQIEEYESQIEKLNKKIDNLEKSISSKQKEIKKLEKEFKEKEEAFLERLVAIYEAGQMTYLDMLLSSDSVINFISNYYMISELAEADKTMMDSIQTQQEKIEQAKKDLESQKAEITASKREIVVKNNEVASKKNERQEKVNSLSAEEKKLQSKQAELEAGIKAAEKEIQKELEKANQSSGGSGYTGSFSGTLSWPVSTSSSYWNHISSGYGRRDQPTAGASTNHKAVDIPISYQTVYAAADGYVVTASEQSGYGNFIMIKHSNNLYTCYGHLSSYHVSSGQTVKRGQAIATSGDTGISSGPHLHFEVRLDGGYDTRVNPLNYISDSVYSQLIFW